MYNDFLLKMHFKIFYAKNWPFHSEHNASTHQLILLLRDWSDGSLPLLAVMMSHWADGKQTPPMTWRLPPRDRVNGPDWWCRMTRMRSLLPWKQQMLLPWRRHQMLRIQRLLQVGVTGLVNSLAPGRYHWNFKVIYFQANFSDWWLRYLLWNCPQMNVTDNKSTLVQVMAWCHQATSHYLSQSWFSSII